MPYWFYQIAHLFSVILLAGVTFAALAAPRPENRRLALMGSGIAAAVALVSGFGMLGLGGFGFPGWVFVKIAAWIVLAALTGLAFRRPGQGQALATIAVLAVFLSVVVVVLKPF